MTSNMPPPDPREAYERWHRALGVDEGATAPWHRMIRGQLDPGRHLVGRPVLEMASGRGGWSHWLLEQPEGQGLLATGDFSLSAVAMGRSAAVAMGLPRALWFAGDLQRLPFADGSFATVFSCETIEHLPSPALGVRELARVLQPRGTLFLSVPNYLNLGMAYRAYRRLTGRPFQEAGQPVNRLMTPIRVGWLLRRSGLKLLRVEGMGHVIPLWPGRPALRLGERWDGIRALRWFASNQLFVATKG